MTILLNVSVILYSRLSLSRTPVIQSLPQVEHNSGPQCQVFTVNLAVTGINGIN